MSGKKGDKRVEMLRSIKPYLSDKRQESLDSVSQMLTMLSFMEGMQKKEPAKKKGKSKKSGDVK